MIPSSSCPPRPPDQAGQTGRRAQTHCRSYTTPWGTIPFRSRIFNILPVECKLGPSSKVKATPSRPGASSRIAPQPRAKNSSRSSLKRCCDNPPTRRAAVCFTAREFLVNIFFAQIYNSGERLPLDTAYRSRLGSASSLDSTTMSKERSGEHVSKRDPLVKELT
jgi:hypothetical protein